MIYHCQLKLFYFESVKVSLTICTIKHKINRSINASWVLTVDVCVLDVNGLCGLFVSCGQSVVDGREDLQDTFCQARLKHHAATPHAYVLAPWVQVRNAH